jgi:thiol-disulfide isomerase/thioredoxin
MLVIWITFTLLMPSLGFDGPRPDLERRYLDLKQAAASYGEANLPWQTFRKYAPEFLRLAEGAPRDPASFTALIWVGEFGALCIDTCKYDGTPGSQLMERAFELLAADHLEDESVGRLCLALPRLPSPARESFLRRVVQESKNPLVRGRACLALAELLKTKLACAESVAQPTSGDVGTKFEDTWGSVYLAHLRGCDRAALGTEAERLLVRVVEEFPGIAFVRGSSETPVWRGTAAKDVAAKKTLGMVADADLEEMRHLAVGDVAPDIEGRDAENVAFKLSDFRGKVVLLTFSGNWCSPCRSMYPYERELVARMRGRQFTLLSVNTDQTVATLRESIRAGEVTWRCWWDGAAGGPIASRWNIRSWPTIYLLDAQGVIRAKNPRDGELDTLIDGLLKEESEARAAGQPLNRSGVAKE